MTNQNNKKFIAVTIDIYCEWLSEAPQYRLYVNNELFTERTFSYNSDTYLQEIIQLHAFPGIYEIKVELLTEKFLNFTAKNLQIKKGHAKVIDDHKFEVF